MEIDCRVWLLFLLSGSCFGAMPKLAEPKEPAKLPQSVILACWNGNAQWIDAFLDEGGDPNAIDGTGLTLFARACARGNMQVVQTLLSHKNFDPKVSLKFKSDGKTPLMWAAWTGKKDVVKLLIEHKAPLESKDAERGSTALILATQANEPECVKELLMAGAEIFTCDEAGHMARRYAQKFKYLEIIALLDKYQKKHKNEKMQKRLAEKEGYEFMQPLDENELKDLEKQNAPAIWNWCAIQ